MESDREVLSLGKRQLGGVFESKPPLHDREVRPLLERAQMTGKCGPSSPRTTLRGDTSLPIVTCLELSRLKTEETDREVLQLPFPSCTGPPSASNTKK